MLNGIKMLLIYFVTILIIAFPIHGGLIHDIDDDTSFSGKTGRYFQRRCSDHPTLADLDEIVAELHNIKKCFLKTLPTHTVEDDEGLEERCFEKREEVKKCLQKLMDLVAPCLPKEESYLPEFVIEAYQGYSDYFCEHIHILTLDGLLETRMANCINRFMKHPEYSPQNVCYESAKFANHSHDTPITKDDICEDLDFVYDCYEKQFKEHCPDAPKAWTFESGLINGLRTPCKDEEKGERNEVNDEDEKHEEEE